MIKLVQNLNSLRSHVGLRLSSNLPNRFRPRPTLKFNHRKALRRHKSDAKWLQYISTGQSNYLVKEILASCVQCLQMKNIPDAEFAAKNIIASALSIDLHELRLVMEAEVTTEVLDKVDNKMECCLARMPIQYIVGNWDFHSITLDLWPPVFIPRPETEELVNLVLNTMQGITAPVMLDIGCGCGAISLAMLHNISDLTCVAVDQSKFATELTTHNAKKLNLLSRIRVVHGKVTEDHFPMLPIKKFDVIVSNPPYVSKKDLMKLQPEIILYEDLRALDGGPDGMDIIKNIIKHGQNFLKHDGTMLLEVDPCHRYFIPEFLNDCHTMMQVMQFHNDFNNECRFAELRKGRSQH